MLKQTPLYYKHLSLKAKMVDFGGWSMPIQYAGIIEEHKNTRHNVSLFDVSHMGEFIIKGKDATSFLNFVTTNNVEKLVDGKAQYTALLYENGTFVDDVILYKIAQNEYQMCVNAVNTQKDFAWLQAHSKQYEIELKNISEKVSLLAIQGRNSIDVIQQIVSFDLNSIKYYEFKKTTIQATKCLIARMGYTGEDGFEMFIPNEKAIFFWDLIMQCGTTLGIKPAGLGARDTLRLEVGFSLYGNDIDDKHTPVEANLNWIVDYNKNFIGKPILQKQKINGVSQKLVAFCLSEKGIPRQHNPVISVNKKNIGTVCSGSFSPMQNVGFGLAYLDTEYTQPNTPIFIDIRGKITEAKVIQMPLYKI